MLRLAGSLKLGRVPATAIMLGRYSFSVPEAVANGELRPLRDPSDND